MKELHQKLGSMEYDGLITGLNPPVRVDGGTIAKLTTPTVLKRGTLLGKTDGSDLLSVYGGTGTPYCILCDDIEVGTDEDVPVEVYAAGCFDPQKVTVADSYSLTQADKDKLRAYSIVFKAALTSFPTE